MTLQEFFDQNKKVALAFSGGTDSSFLLYVAKLYNCDVAPYFVKSQFQPQFELEDAKAVADFVKVEMKTIDKDILTDENISNNPKNRCYYCKKSIFDTILDEARKDGYTTIIDGTNASDSETERPGMKALSEMKALSPLKLCGITKSDVRRLSKEVGLFTYKKKSYSCLATRIATDTKITKEALEKIEKSEEIIEKMGFENFRVRDCEKYAKIQIEESQFELAIQNREKITAELKQFYSDIYLDLTPRKSGE
ncbi:MAG: ATP-dependent sacrificial sulfur transferase LarE [Clostridia bacterium]